MRDKLDSYEETTGGLFELVTEKNAELAEKATELAAKDAAIKAAEARAEKLRIELEAARVVVPTAPSRAALERAERHVAWLKVAGALVAILGAGTTYLSIRANSVIEPRVDVTQAKQEAAKLVTDTDHSTQLRVLEYLRADRARQDCVEAQIGSALVRGTGHRLTGLPDTGIEWAEQQRPPTKPAALWEHSVWFTVIPCAVAPHPP